MTLADLQKACEAELFRWQRPEEDGAHDLGHARRVLAHCRAIALAEGAGDEEILIPAAILHDAVNLPKDHPHRAEASRLSAERASAFLGTVAGFPAAKIPAVAHAIAAHSFSAGIAPQTLEACILQDADRLEALGAIGLARMFHVAGQIGGALFDPFDPMAERRPLDDRAFALDHLEVKLFALVPQMKTRAGQRLARERAAFMAAFREQLLREID